MAWDFPPASEGAVYTPAGGPTYTYSGGIWRTLPPATSALSSKSIGDTPPLNPIHGQSWWNSVDGFSYIYYVDPGGAPGQWVQESDASLPDAPSDGGFYVRSGGTWVQVPRYQRFSMSGIRTIDIPVPAGAVSARLTGMVTSTAAVAFATYLQLSVSSGVFLTAAGPYTCNGYYNTVAPGPVVNHGALYAVATTPAMLVAGNHNNTGVPVIFDGQIALVKSGTGGVFGADFRAQAEAGTTHFLLGNYLVSTATNILALRFCSSDTNVFSSSSYIAVEWM